MGAPQPIAVSIPGPVDDAIKSGEESTERAARLLPLSGKSNGALKELAGRYLTWLDGEDCSASDGALSDLAWTASIGRSHFEHRAGVVFSDAEQLRQRLGALVETVEDSSDGKPNEALKVAFAYTGDSSLLAGMGEALYGSEPVARAVLDLCEDLVRQERGVSLLDVVFGHSGAEDEMTGPYWSAPATYALECALTSQWASVGINPGAVVSQGAGALAAAQAAGVFSLEDGLRLAMALGDHSRINSEDQASKLANIELAAPSVSFVDSVNGRLVDPGNALSLDFWLRRAQDSAERDSYAKTLSELEVNVVIEISASSSPGQNANGARLESVEAPAVLSTLVKTPPEGDPQEASCEFARAVAGAYELGLNISFDGLFAGEVRRRVALPTYPFQRRRHWV